MRLWGIFTLANIAGFFVLLFLFCFLFFVVVFVSYVLDGWPLTKAQTDRLSDCHIIPVCILEMDVNTKEILRRARKDRTFSER